MNYYYFRIFCLFIFLSSAYRCSATLAYYLSAKSWEAGERVQIYVQSDTPLDVGGFSLYFRHTDFFRRFRLVGDAARELKIRKVLDSHQLENLEKYIMMDSNVEKESDIYEISLRIPLFFTLRGKNKCILNLRYNFFSAHPMRKWGKLALRVDRVMNSEIQEEQPIFVGTSSKLKKDCENALNYLYEQCKMPFNKHGKEMKFCKRDSSSCSSCGSDCQTGEEELQVEGNKRNSQLSATGKTSDPIAKDSEKILQDLADRIKRRRRHLVILHLISAIIEPRR
jgi:hypothetical protein